MIKFHSVNFSEQHSEGVIHVSFFRCSVYDDEEEVKVIDDKNVCFIAIIDDDDDDFFIFFKLILLLSLVGVAWLLLVF